MAQLNDNVSFLFRNLNINELMLINFHISLVTKLFFLSFDRHTDKTVTLSELLLNINNFRNKTGKSLESLMSLASKLYELLR